MATYLDIDLVSGKKTRRSTVQSSAGVADADKIPSLNAQGHIDITMIPPGVGDDAKDIEAGEALSTGDFINIYDDGGTPKVRKADASNGRAAHGFVLDNYAAAATATVYFEGSNDQLALLTAGTRYYLDKSTPGGVTDDVSAYLAGDIHQFIGVGAAANCINFEGADCIDL